MSEKRCVDCGNLYEVQYQDDLHQRCDELAVVVIRNKIALAGYAIVVDTLQQWGVAKTGQAARHFGEGKHSCHLTVIGPLDELHSFAKKIGMRRDWFQSRASWPHYDLTSGKRQIAMQRGAVFCSGVAQARVEKQLRSELREKARQHGATDWNGFPSDVFGREIVAAWMT